MKEWITSLTMFLIFGGFFWFLVINKIVTEKRLERKISQEAIKGNEIAIYMMKDRFWVREEKKDVIREALKGNKYAIEALGIKEEDLLKSEEEKYLFRKWKAKEKYKKED